MIAEIAVKKGEVKKIDTIYTLEEYFKLEETAAFKSEFINGKIIRMSGGTINHSRIKIVIASLLYLGLMDKEDIEVLDSDLKIYLPIYNRSVYPDTCVVTEKPDLYNNKPHAITNPTLIVEVTSKSTGDYDRSGKFRMYQSLPSFTEYVLVDQNTPVVDVFYKITDNKWQMTSYIGLDKVITLESLDITLSMADIYKKVTDLKDPQLAIDFPEEPTV